MSVLNTAEEDFPLITPLDEFIRRVFIRDVVYKVSSTHRAMCLDHKSESRSYFDSNEHQTDQCVYPQSSVRMAAVHASMTGLH